MSSSKGTGPSGGTQSKKATSSGSGQIRFLVEIKRMTAIFKTKPANFANAALWQPPGKAKDLEAGPSQWYYWTGGNMSPANPPSLVDPLETASVFRQNNGGYILGTFGDATQEVPPTGWRTLQFHRGPTTTGCFTQIDLIGPLEGAASPLPDHIVPELLPHIYQCQSNKPPEFAGLTGKLSLLIAIAALSASWDELRNIMTKHVKPRRWVPHGKGSAKKAYAGVVVSICRDPSNQRSDAAVLRRLEAGDTGAIYS